MNDEQLLRYSRQIMLPDFGIDGQERLGASRFLLIGLGGLGSPVAMYLAADVMLVTPLRDGMNLVAKEYVASRADGHGALVLSEFTGASEQMTQAWLVNPYDIDGMKRTIMAALREPPGGAASRMTALRHGVFTEDVRWWADSFLATLAAEPAAPAEPL